MRLIKYFFVGGVAAALDISIFIISVQIFAVNYLIIAPISFVLATLLNYYLSIRIVFTSGARFSRQWELIAIFIVSGISLIINQATLFITVEIFFLHKVAAKIIATGVVFFWNYFSRRNFIFKVR